MEHGFQDWQDDSPFSLSSKMAGEPFLAYAYDAWPSHARSVSDDPTTRRLQEFLSGCHAFPVTQGLGHRLLGPLHVAAFFDLPIALAGFGPATTLDPNPVTEEGETPLHVAYACNSLRAIKELLQLPATLVNARDGQGTTPLTRAVEEENEVALTLLLARQDIDVNASGGSYGASALAIAVLNGSLSIVELLLAHPLIDINVMVEKGQTLLLWALRGNHVGIVEILLADPRLDINLAEHEGWTPLLWAAKEGRKALLERLLAHRQIEVNLSDLQGQTALIWASLKGHITAVETLLTHPEIDVNLADKSNCTPLFWSLKASHWPVFRTLLSHPHVDVNVADSSEGFTPVIWAAKAGNASALKALLAHRQVDINRADHMGRTALIWAMLMVQPTLADLLLALPQVDVNAVDKGGETALHCALRRGSMASAKNLLAHPKINTNLADNRRRTPLSLARARGHGHEEIVDLILTHLDSSSSSVSGHDATVVTDLRTPSPDPTDSDIFVVPPSPTGSDSSDAAWELGGAPRIPCVSLPMTFTPTIQLPYISHLKPPSPSRYSASSSAPAQGHYDTRATQPHLLAQSSMLLPSPFARYPEPQFLQDIQSDLPSFVASPIETTQDGAGYRHETSPQQYSPLILFTRDTPKRPLSASESEGLASSSRRRLG
jgi:ankyrin repeat protein